MHGDSQIENLTLSIQDILSQAGVVNGTLTLFVKHTTASVMIIEDEPGIRVDTQKFWNATIPAKTDWQHNTKNPGEDNGHSLVEHCNEAVGHHRAAHRVSLSSLRDCVAPLAKEGAIACEARLALNDDKLTELAIITLIEH